MLTDNVCILCLSCNVKNSKVTTKLSENSKNKHRSNSYQWCHLSCSHLYCYCFLLLFYMNQVPEKLYFGHWPYISKNFQSVQTNCLDRTSAGGDACIHLIWCDHWLKSLYKMLSYCQHQYQAWNIVEKIILHRKWFVIFIANLAGILHCLYSTKFVLFADSWIKYSCHCHVHM